MYKINKKNLFCRCDTFGDTYAIYLIHRVLVVTRSPDALKTILVNGDQKLFAKSEVIKARWLFSTRYNSPNNSLRAVVVGFQVLWPTLSQGEYVLKSKIIMALRTGHYLSAILSLQLVKDSYSLN